MDNRIGRVRIYPESSFGADMIASLASFLDVPIRGNATLTTSQDMLDPETEQQRMDGRDVQVLGPKSASATIPMILASHGTALVGPNTTPPSSATWPLGALLKTCMGGERAQTPSGSGSTTVAASPSPTASVFSVTAGHGSRWQAGDAVGVVINGKVEAGVVKSVATDALTLKVALSAAPSAGAAVYSAVSFYLTESPSQTVNMVAEGLETSDRWQGLGLTGGFGIGMAARGLPTIDFNLVGAKWNKLGTATLAKATYTNFTPFAVKDSAFVVGVVGSTTRNLVHWHDSTWTPGITYEGLPTPEGVENLLGYVRIKGGEATISGSLTGYYSASDYDFFAAHQGRYNLAFFQQLGSTAPGTILLEAPTVQIGPPQRAAAGNIAGVTFPWRGRLDEELGDASEWTRSAFRIHCF